MTYEHLARWGKRGLCPLCGSRLTTRESNICPEAGGTTTTSCTEPGCPYEIVKQTTKPYNPLD